MGQVREIKCPSCGEWTMWKGDVDDRCFFCDEFLEPQRFSREVEKKIRFEIFKESDYFFVKPEDSPLKQRIKRLLNSTRWLVVYFQIAFFIFISFLLVLLSLFSG